MNTTKKRNIAILCTVLMTASLLIGGTLAYFSDQETITNPFTTAGNGGPGDESGLDIEVTEPGYDPEDSKDMVPGDVIVKDPTVTNLKGESYVRFIIKLVDKTSGAVITDAARADKILSTLFYDPQNKILTTSKYTLAEAAALAGVRTPINPQFVKDTVRSSTGNYVFNYNGTMTTGDSAVLFNKVIIPTNWNQADIAALGNYDIVVTGQAIQAANMSDANEAFAALDAEPLPTPAP